jgi:hypothetical protein
VEQYEVRELQRLHELPVVLSVVHRLLRRAQQNKQRGSPKAASMHRLAGKHAKD